MSSDINPFPIDDVDRYQIWDMLVRRDIEAFARNDWAAHSTDFLADHFFAVDARGSADPDRWTNSFGSLQAYAEKWQAFAQSCFGKLPSDEIARRHFDATTLRDIDVNGDHAIAHKKLVGVINFPDGTVDALDWQTVYLCRKREGRWWVTGFVGYLPNLIPAVR